MRIAEAQKQVQEHMKLGNRTAHSLELLLESTSISSTRNAITSLEMATRLSDVCAQCTVELGAIEKLYEIMRSCNRSKPELMLAKQCLQTLSNFTLYKTRFRDDLCILPLTAEALAEFIQNMREADEDAVLLAVGLLRFICTDESKASEIAALPARGSLPTPMHRLNMTLNMLQKKIPKPINNRKPQTPKLVVELQSLIQVIGQNK